MSPFHLPRDAAAGGIPIESTQYHTIICWGQLGETVSQWVRKGEPVYVEGRLEYRTFQDEEGKERGVAEVIVQHVCAEA